MCFNTLQLIQTDSGWLLRLKFRSIQQKYSALNHFWPLCLVSNWLVEEVSKQIVQNNLH